MANLMCLLLFKEIRLSNHSSIKKIKCAKGTTGKAIAVCYGIDNRIVYHILFVMFESKYLSVFFIIRTTGKVQRYKRIFCNVQKTSRNPVVL